MTIADAILRLRNQAVAAGIPPTRLYLGPVKRQQFEEWAEAETGTDISEMQGEFCEMQVVRMKEPGMAIGE